MGERPAGTRTSVADGPRRDRSTEVQLDALSTSWELLLFCALILIVGMWQADSGGADPVALSGQALSEGRWWTLFTHMFVPSLGLSSLASALLVVVALPIVPRTTVAEGLEQGARSLALFMGCGLVGATMFLVTHWERDAPLTGLWSAVAGWIAYRSVRGRSALSWRPGLRERVKTGAARDLLNAAGFTFALFSVLAALEHDSGPLEGTMAQHALSRIFDDWRLQGPLLAALFLGSWLSVRVGLVLVLASFAALGSLSWEGLMAWIGHGATPWESLLAAIILGGLLGWLFPDLLPRPLAASESA